MLRLKRHMYCRTLLIAGACPFSIQVPIFASADSAFLRHLALMIKPCLFLPKEYIVHQGDVGLGMFFLYHGTVIIRLHKQLYSGKIVVH